MLLSLGNSQMDMYTGALSIDTIFEEVVQQLSLAGVHDRRRYEAFLQQQNNYATISLSDTSRWILRLAPDKDNYIHLHPGRYSPHTLRVKASALKTALAYKVAQQYHLLEGDLLNDINEVRKELTLAPVKSLGDSAHILELLSLLGCLRNEP